MQLLSGLLAAGVPGGDIGIISPYKAQVCACLGGFGLATQELLTSDKCGAAPAPCVPTCACVVTCRQHMQCISNTRCGSSISRNTQ
jgi:hypothetical protein